MEASTESLHVSKRRRVTYLGVPAEEWTIAKTKGAAERHGERVHAIRWLDGFDEGDVIVALIAASGPSRERTGTPLRSGVPAFAGGAIGRRG